MTQKSKREKEMEEKEHVETQYFRLQPWVKGWAEAIIAPPGGETYRRLCRLLAGPGPVNGVPSRPPCLDAESLFADFVEYLDLPETPQAMESLGDLLSAIFTYGREKNVDMAVLVDPWGERQFLGPTRDFGHPGKIDMRYIISSLFLARMFALELGYGCVAWLNLLEGLGLSHGDRWVSDSTLMGACAQLLGGGHRIRKWCAGIGLAGRPNYFDSWLEKPSKKQDFHEVLAAVEVWYEKTENEWTKAVLLATKEHFQFGFRDLTREAVCEIIFKKTKPGTASGDEATVVEQAENGGTGERVGDVAAL